MILVKIFTATARCSLVTSMIVTAALTDTILSLI